MTVSEDIAYFTGKKVPFAKTQIYRQCLMNPFRQNGSIITVQALGSLLSSNQSVSESTEANTVDKFLRKMEFYEKNIEVLTVKPDLSVVDLFLDSSYGASESKLVTFGKLELIGDNAKDNWDAAIVQFWTKDSEG